MKKVVTMAFLLLFGRVSARGQSKLRTQWEELTAEDFRAAIEQSKGICLLPFGIERILREEQPSA
jgi:creatinine amidohydrolase